jgi:F-type H+-transporting ATPase subunit gamma
VQPGELAARARTVSQLGDIVQAMRTLASARRRQAQEQFSGLERYAEGTRTALAEAMALLGVSSELPAASTEARRVLALLSEHGFVGALNERMLDRALALQAERGGRLVVAGRRGQRLARERGVEATDGGAMPTTVGGVQATAERLIDAFFGAIGERGVGEVHLVFAEHRAPFGWRPSVLRLYPPEVLAAQRPRAVEPPLCTLEPRVLVARAIEEFAFAQVSWAVAEAFASEQAARFVAMDSARHHIDDKLGELHALERALRQEAITSELLEIAVGAGALQGAP